MRRRLIYMMLLVSLAANAQLQVAQLETATSRFRQVRTSAMWQEPETRMGTFEYAAPDQIRWTYDGLENLQLPEQMRTLIRQAVSGRIEGINELFHTEWQEMTLTMTPRKKPMRRLFSSIQIVFSPNGVARQVILTEPSGDVTAIEFVNIRYTIRK